MTHPERWRCGRAPEFRAWQTLPLGWGPSPSVAWPGRPGSRSGQLLPPHLTLHPPNQLTGLWKNGWYKTNPIVDHEGNLYLMSIAKRLLQKGINNLNNRAREYKTIKPCGDCNESYQRDRFIEIHWKFNMASIPFYLRVGRTVWGSRGCVRWGRPRLQTPGSGIGTKCTP